MLLLKRLGIKGLLIFAKTIALRTAGATCLPFAWGADSREDKMVCVACNGKGYVVEKGRESHCSECQGRGEYPNLDSFKLPKIESQDDFEAQRSANFSA
jgi:hypothetical protein